MSDPSVMGRKGWRAVLKGDFGCLPLQGVKVAAPPPQVCKTGATKILQWAGGARVSDKARSSQRPKEQPTSRRKIAGRGIEVIGFPLRDQDAHDG
jgi:hypothetical protein